MSFSSVKRPIAAAATVATVAAVLAFNASRPRALQLTASQRASHTLTFPYSMIFSRELKVKQVEQVNHDTKRITFDLPGGENETSGVPASAAILTQHTAPGAWLPTFRPYTPISEPDRPGVLELMVKLYPNGRASSHLHKLQPGDSLTVRGPLPGYTYKPSRQPRSIIVIAGGAGITPIYSLVREILTRDPSDQTSVELLWGVNGLRDIVLKDELDALEKSHAQRLRVTYAIPSHETNSDEKCHKGRVDHALVEKSVMRCGNKLGDEKGTKVFLCGPPKMEDAIAGEKGVLAGLGIRKNEIHRF